MYRYGIDREVSPGEILFDRRRLNRRQDSGLRVGLSPGRRDIHLEPVRELEPRRRKPFKHRQPSPIPVGHQTREGDPISLYREIEIPVLSLQQEIADDSADKVQGTPHPHPRGSQAHEAGKDAPEGDDATDRFGSYDDSWHAIVAISFSMRNNVPHQQDGALRIRSKAPGFTPYSIDLPIPHTLTIMFLALDMA